MATWREQYYYQGFLWIHKPEIVFQGTVDDVTDSVVIVDTTTLGSFSDILPNMTIALGSSAGLYDKGRARVHLYHNPGGGLDSIYTRAPLSFHDGERYGVAGDHITIYDERRLWMKPTTIDSTGNLRYSSISSIPNPSTPDGMTFDQVPIANGGAAYGGFCDDATGLITVTFPSVDSFAVADDAVLGAYTAGIFSGGEALTSEGFINVANAIDGNAGTYATSETASVNGPDWLARDLGDGNEAAIRKFDIRSTTGLAPEVFFLEWSDDNTNWVVAYHGNETGWGATEERTFYVHHAGEHRYWRFKIIDQTGGTLADVRIYEWQLYAEDRTSGTSPWSWDVKDGTITAGSTTSENITATFPSGFRYVELSVTDTNGVEGKTDIPVVASPSAKSGTYAAELWYGDGIQSATNTRFGQPGSNVFDNDNATWWATNDGITAARVKINYVTLAKRAKSYGIICNSAAHAIKDWAVEGSNDNIVWTPIDTQTGITSWAANVENAYSIASPADYIYYRLNISDNNGAPFIAVYEFNLYGDEPVTGGETIGGFEVASHTMEPTGQIMEFIVHDDIPASTYTEGAFVMYWEREVYDGVEGSLSAAGPTGREHVKFSGWIDNEPTSIRPEESATIRTTALRCLDIGQKMRQLGTFPIMAARDDVPTEGWEMKHPNVDVLIYLMIRWLSTAAEIADFIWSNTIDHYSFTLLAAQGSSLYDSVQGKARAIDHNLVCDKSGAIRVVPDLLTSADQFSANADTAETLTPSDYGPFDYQGQHTSRVKWNDGSGVRSLAVDYDDPNFDVETDFTILPGEVPGQGTESRSDNEQVSSHEWDDNPFTIGTNNRSDIFQRNGRSYAQAASVVSDFGIDIVHAGDTGLDPAAADWLNITLPSSTAAQRGLTLTDQPGVIKRIEIQHDHEAMTKQLKITWERQETFVYAYEYDPA